MRPWRFAAALLALTLCASPRAALADVEPFAAPPDRASLIEAEERAWAVGDDFDRNIRRARNLYRDEALQAYLQSLIDLLYPEFRGAIVLKGIVRDAVPSAFVFPNGSVYVTLGLVGRLSSEAQLATVLGHEAAHWVHRHGYQQMQSAKSLSALGLGLGVVSGLGPMGNVLMAGVLYGYSRDHERDADRIGFERVVRAGFAPRSGVETFELLAAEAQLYDVQRPTFFASHPSMIERVKTIREILASRPSVDEVPVDPAAAAARAGRYRDAVRAARLDYLKLAVETDRQKSVITMLEPAFESGECEPAAAFWLAEAYRLRGGEGDAAQALRTYRWVLGRAPQLAAAWRGIGEIQHRAGANAEAADAFERYLDGAPQATDAEAVRAEIAHLRAGPDEEGRERNP